MFISFVLLFFCLLTYSFVCSSRTRSAGLFEAAVQHMAYKKSLVREVQLGPMKQKIDDGLGMRKLAFNFLDACCENLMGVVAAANVVTQICGVGGETSKDAYSGICSALRFGPNDDAVVVAKAMALLLRLCVAASSQVKAQLDELMKCLKRYVWLPAAGKNAFQKKKALYLAQGWVHIATTTMAALSNLDNAEANRKYSEALANIKSPDAVGHAELLDAYTKALKSAAAL